MSDKTKFHKGPFAIAWAVFRGDEFYSAHRTRKIAREIAGTFRPGSKQKWDVGKVGIVNPVSGAGEPS